MVAKSPHIASISDRPITKDAEDGLGRARFAKSIADLILSAPAQETLRIGVYGGWGEGKTSALRLIEARVREAGHFVAWITPWATASRETLVDELIRRLAKELKISIRVAARRWVRPLRFFAEKSGAAAELDPRVKAAESLLGDGIRSVLKKASDDQVAAVFTKIRKAVGERKVVVIVDDLDRVRPELVPEMLLLLREALDQPNFFYILALDPAVVTRGLAQVHQAWGNSTEFLEKIIELPRRLPAPTNEDIRGFIHEQIDRADPTLHRNVLITLGPILTRNPRKLKMFLRYLASLASVTSRLGDDEIDWEAFYLCQMMRIEFSDEALRIADDKAVIDDLEHGAMHDRLQLRGGNAPPAPPFDRYVPTSEVNAKRFRTIIEAIRERGRWKGRYSLRDCLILPDDPPLMTWKEFDEFLSSFADLASQEEQEHALEDALTRIQTPRQRAVAGMFELAIAVRQMVMEVAVDAKTDESIRAHLTNVGHITTILEMLASAGALTSDSDGASRYLRLLQHVSVWAHFDTPAYHRDLRERERDVLIRMLTSFSGDGLLAIYEKWDPFEAGLTVGADHPHRAFLRVLEQTLAGHIVLLLLDRLRVPDGMNMFWGNTWMRVKTLLFSPESPIFRDATNRAGFLRLARVADSSSDIAGNFHTYIRMLGYGAFGEATTFDRRACRAMLADHELIEAVWNAAIAIPLQPRQVGAMAETREKLIEAGVPENHLQVPEWFIAAQNLFARERPAN